jgi:hypothetical protein
MTDGQIEYKGGDPNLYHPQMLVVTITKKTQTQKADHGMVLQNLDGVSRPAE